MLSGYLQLEEMFPCSILARGCSGVLLTLQNEDPEDEQEKFYNDEFAVARY